MKIVLILICSDLLKSPRKKEYNTNVNSSLVNVLRVSRKNYHVIKSTWFESHDMMFVVCSGVKL